MVSLGIVVAAVSLISGWDARASAVMVVSVPMLAFVLAGLSSPRGALVGGLVLALGATLSRPSPAGFPWADALLLSGLVFSAQVGAGWADAHTPRRVAPAPGRWAQIIVSGSGQADGAGRAVHVPMPPRRDPERRRLSRRVEPRHRAPVRAVD